MSSSLLSSLRAYTHEQHEALHAHPLLACLQQKEIRLNDYYWCLKAFDAVYRQLAGAVRFRLADSYIPNILEWLERDFQTHRLARLSLPSPPYPAVQHYSQWIGMRYVVQGSMLGGQVISKHLHQYLDLKAQVTNHFFAGLGENTGPQWKAFIALMDDAAMDVAQATHQAVATFKLIQDVCDETWERKQQSVETGNITYFHHADTHRLALSQNDDSLDHYSRRIGS